MHLTHLRVHDFRNLAAVEIAPSPRFNVLVGANGQGKTNTLAALYWLATLRPLRARRLREVVRWGQPGVRVDGTVTHEGLEHALAVGLVDGARVAWREGKRCRASAYFGALELVVFTPDDVALVRGTPEARRRFLDRAVFTGRPAHLAAVLSYRKALSGRNRLLREAADDAVLEAFEGALARAAAALIDARRSYLTDFSPRFAAAWTSITGEGPSAAVRYRASLDPDQGGAEALAAAWAADRPRDRDRGFTQRGPHADDLVLRLGDRPARTYASQGQQRAMVLALKIAEIEALEAACGHAPVLLLDDVSSELDPGRTERLFEFLGGFGGQVFITTTDRAFLRIKGEQKAWRVQAGALAEWE